MEMREQTKRQPYKLHIKSNYTNIVRLKKSFGVQDWHSYLERDEKRENKRVKV